MFRALHKILTAVWEDFIMMICCNVQAALPLSILTVAHFRSSIVLWADKKRASFTGRSVFLSFNQEHSMVVVFSAVYVISSTFGEPGKAGVWFCLETSLQ